MLDADVRILPIHTERDGRRFRALRDSEPEMVEEPFEDWPLEGTRSVGHVLRELRRADQSFLTHHESWKRLSGISAVNRAGFEHQTLCVALHYMVVYDQLNVVNLASAEALNCRRQLIEHAHEHSADAPVYDGAEDFLGFRMSSTGALVDPQRLAYVASRQSAKCKILEETRKAQEARSAYLRRGGRAEGAGAGAQAADADGAKGAGKRR